MSGNQLYARKFDNFPTRGDHDARWHELAQAIAAERDRITEHAPPLRPPEVPGQLIVIGSGIEAVGFTATDEMLIREADHVFFCVADPATSVWLKALRPDAYDLYVLYDDTKRRYLTYMQMAEAMLHFVRRGRKVVAIYYGHPGVFVLSSHRAIRIARREGHAAVMRAAVSALDTLCADIGIDPSQPGMVTYEATDMLIRRRRPDPSLHVVLWQVGLIGELGYRRQGYLNSGFSVLLDYLEEVYGPDQSVINYVGSRYPGIPPLLDYQTITTLRDPDRQAKVTGISTFYLPPTESAQADQAMLEKLGLLKPGQTPRISHGPLREIDRYGAREMRAFDDFARFRVPTDYHWQEDTAAARFILALREDGTLRDLYAREPAAGVATWPSEALSARDRTLLARRDAGAMQLAAKGSPAGEQGQMDRLLRTLLTSTSAARDLLRGVRRAGSAGRAEVLARWSAARGDPVDWSAAPEILRNTLRRALHPWNGFYLDAQREISLFLLGRPDAGARDRVYLNGCLLAGVRYENGQIRWRAEAGNPSSGQLRVDISPRRARRLIGAVWPAGETPASHHRLTALEHVLPANSPLAVLAGDYRSKDAAGREIEVVLRAEHDDSGGRIMRALIDGRPAAGCVTIGRAGITIDGLEVPFSGLVRGTGIPTRFQGGYLVRMRNGSDTRLRRWSLGDNGIAINGYSTVAAERRGAGFTWADGPAELTEGEVTPLLDPITLKPMLFGSGRATDGQAVVSLVGMVPLTDREARALAARPGFGVPFWAWAHLAAIAVGASRAGGLFLWHGWVKAATNLRRVNAILNEARP